MAAASLCSLSPPAARRLPRLPAVLLWRRRAAASGRRALLTSTPARASDSDLAALRAIVGEAHVLDGASHDAAPFQLDWLKQYPGRAACVVRPADTAQVAAVLRLCGARGLGVVPQGGNTGLVGGGVPRAAAPRRADEVVLSLQRLSRIENFDEDSMAVVCGAGTVLQALDAFLAERGCMVPLDLGSKGSCVLGGNVSTNAGGLRLLRYGSLHGSVLGLEVVTARGETLDMLSTLRKDNVGFDVKQLFVGSEGALGVVTRVALLAAPRPSSVSVAVFGVASFDNCRRLLRLARAELGETLSAAEFVDGRAMQLTLETLKLASPFASADAGAAGAGAGAGASASASTGAAEAHAFNFFVETAGCNAAHDAEKLAGFLERASEQGLIADGVVAADSAQARRLFRLREDVSVALSQRGHVFKYDVSLRLRDMDALVQEMRARLDARGWAARGVVTVGYGHIGDGNLHLNISTPGRAQDYLSRLAGDIEPFVYERVLALGGSVSAEHGVGQAKVEWLARSKPAPVVALMRTLKSALDPDGTLNPGKVLPAADEQEEEQQAKGPVASH